MTTTPANDRRLEQPTVRRLAIHSLSSALVRFQLALLLSAEPAVGNQSLLGVETAAFGGQIGTNSICELGRRSRGVEPEEGALGAEPRQLPLGVPPASSKGAE